MSTRLVYAALVSAALLSSCSSQTPSDVRPEVSRPLSEAVTLSYQMGTNAGSMAKLNQAASVPNLNKDERDKIRKVKSFVVSQEWNRAGGPAGNDISTVVGGWPDIH
jgi:hypothetical protein